MDVKALQQLLGNLQQAQERLQKQIENLYVEGSAGGGMVVVKMNGRKQVTDVRIEQEVYAEKDHEMLADLIRAAVNDAVRRVDDEMSTQMQSVAGSLPGVAGLRIPGLF